MRVQEKERETDGERCIGYVRLSAPHFAESRRMLDERKQKRKNLLKETNKWDRYSTYPCMFRDNHSGL